MSTIIDACIGDSPERMQNFYSNAQFLKKFLKYNLNFIHPDVFYRSLNENGGVAQLVRVPDCRSGCCGFESRRSRHFFHSEPLYAGV